MGPPDREIGPSRGLQPSQATTREDPREKLKALRAEFAKKALDKAAAEAAARHEMDRRRRAGGLRRVGAGRLPEAAEVRRDDMLGLWRAQFEGVAHGATLLLERHPELGGSVRDAINRDGARALLAGDVVDGEFTLEESVNGTSISAVWLGDVVEGSCGREIRGAWKAEGDARQLHFVLRKQ